MVEALGSETPVAIPSSTPVVVRDERCWNVAFKVPPNAIELSSGEVKREYNGSTVLDSSSEEDDSSEEEDVTSEEIKENQEAFNAEMDEWWEERYGKASAELLLDSPPFVLILPGSHI